MTGTAYTADGNPYAFLWKNDGTPMVNLTPGNASWADDINDSGQLTGVNDFAGIGYHAALWASNDLSVQDLGTLGGTESEGFELNERGQVAGWSYKSGNHITQAFLWKNNGRPMLNLGTLGGYNRSVDSMNSSGQVTGWSEIKPGQRAVHAYFWGNDHRMVDIGPPGSTNNYPVKINDSGQIVGSADFPGGLSLAFVWMNDGRPTFTLSGLGTSNGAMDINSFGWVVGGADINHAFLWKDDGNGMRDLNSLIDPTDPLKQWVVLTQGLAINDAGDIMAIGTDFRTGNNSRLFPARLFACPVPPHPGLQHSEHRKRECTPVDRGA